MSQIFYFRPSFDFILKKIKKGGNFLSFFST